MHKDTVKIFFLCLFTSSSDLKYLLTETRIPVTEHKLPGVVELSIRNKNDEILCPMCQEVTYENQRRPQTSNTK